MPLDESKTLKRSTLAGPLRPLFVAVLALLALAAFGREFSADFALVMIDDATEKKLGAFPYDRARYAKAVEACAHLRAKAVVLKFFLDEPKSPEGDVALATAMKKIPVCLQARLEDSDGTAGEIPARFRYAGGGNPAAALQGQRGWIPLPLFLEAAAGVGFVDFDGPEIPLIENYRHAPLKSLVLECLELATGETARATGKNRIEFGAKSLPVDRSNVFHGTLNPPERVKIISFASLLDGGVDADAIAGRVVIIGWDSVRTPTLPTPHGAMRIHQLYVQCLAAAWRSLAPTSPTVPPAPP